MGSAYDAADVLAALLVEPPRCETCGGGCELVVGAHSGFGAWVWPRCVCSVHEGAGRAVGLEAVWEAESRTWRPTDQGLLADPGSSPRSSRDGRRRFPRRRTRVVAAGAVGAVGDAWGLYARVFYRYLARRMPGVEPLEMSAAIGMVAGQNWPGLVDAWELSVLNPGVSLDDAGDYLACVVPYPRRRVVGPSSAREALDLAHDAFDRERELLVAEVGVTPTDRQPGDLMTCGPFVLTAGRRAPWARELWVRRQQAGSDHGFAGRLEMTDRGVVDLNECSDPAARTCVEEWLRSADDPFADIVRAEAWRAATDAFGERPTPTQRVRLRYHRAAVAATTLPADRRGLALSRLVGAWRNAIHNDDPSCIPEPDEVRAWH